MGSAGTAACAGDQNDFALKHLFHLISDIQTFLTILLIL
jgi:hypothetical protein